jgi:hypothetical protein
MVSLIAAKPYFFCLDTKETKNQVSRNASLPHWAIALQNQAKPGLEKFAAIMCALAQCAAKISYALPLHTRSPSFCLISSEAVLLTGKEKSSPCHCER